MSIHTSKASNWLIHIFFLCLGIGLGPCKSTCHRKELELKKGLALVNNTPIRSVLTSIVCSNTNVLVTMAKILNELFCEVT
uniref:Secreted protein n=2 Tax=Physcomitrium patens TaxID=3218 RepID=A0A2K1KSY8_PHYPA|nr:hypothetical protein PHYPA_003872 [Physcomitrium patens]